MSDVRNNLKNARRRARPLPKLHGPVRITHRGEDYPKTGTFFDLLTYYQQIYESKCDSCGRTLRVRGQRDNGRPEYECDIEVECICGGGVAFSIPVN